FAVGFGRIDRCSPPGGLWAVVDAVADGQPLLHPMQSRGGYRILAGGAVWGGTEAAVGPGGARAAGDRCFDRKEHRAAAQLCLRADALRPSFPCRRRRPYRAADRRQRIESCGQRRALPVASFHRALRRKIRRWPRSLFRPRAGAGVESRALLMVDDHADASDLRQQFRSQDPTRRIRLSVPLESGDDRFRRELRGIAVLKAWAFEKALKLKKTWTWRAARLCRKWRA